MVTATTLERLEELEQRLASLGLGDYREAVDEALRALSISPGTLAGAGTLPATRGLPLAVDQQRRMLTLGRKANRGSLTPEERREYAALIQIAEDRSRQAALDALASQR